ncbi:hypothetical protein [Candidatus Regiella insecticola]|uniref:Uncharacterized protein n=1 Tax=Candidatus Regiella insecticola TaxID=138073 RepID=A0A6L2ZQM1_9ENTR|nr:hypothetical protein [Candidatus Regiella insecticola]GFN46488.1 hypothetical protein RINTU1_21400 [Candidatus Regiella insecticola]
MDGTPEGNHFVLINERKEKKGYFLLKIEHPFIMDEEDAPDALIVSENGEDYSWKLMPSKGAYLNPKNSNGNNKYISLGKSTVGAEGQVFITQHAFNDVDIPFKVTLI